MIIVKLKGGLGNQMFQYACGRALSLRSGRPLYLDVSNYSEHGGFGQKKETPRLYGLHRFNIVGEVLEGNLPHSDNKIISLTKQISTKIYRKVFDKYNIGFNPHVLERLSERARRGDTVILDGSWWSEKYFEDAEDIIRKDLSLRYPLGDVARVVENEIRHAKSGGNRTVSIHIRRGDYVLNPETNSYHGVCSKEYYSEALKAIEGTKNLFVFSDDIHWVKENMQFPFQTSYVSQPGIEDYEELILMSQCSDHIIANSSFSWWAAWLDARPNKIVVAPLKWTQAEIADSEAMIPESWIRIP